MTFPREKESLGYVLAAVCRQIRREAHAHFEGLGLHRGQNFILRILWEEEGLSQSELADRLGLSPATITNALQNMEKADLVRREQDAEDQRISRVYLTETGQAIRSRAEVLWQALEDRAFGGLSAEEHAQLHTLLLRVRDNLDGGCDGGGTCS
ncbi:MAG: MarR family winged helix-turn-helix transcriptional regulator [Anaerolineales bacterium]